MRCGKGYGGHSEGGDEWEFDAHPKKRRYEQAKLEYRKSYQWVRPNSRLVYASGKVEERHALLTTNQTVGLAAEVKVDAVEGKAEAITQVKQGRNGI